MSKIAKFQLHLEAAFGVNFWSFFCILEVPLSIIILIRTYSKGYVSDMWPTIAGCSYSDMAVRRVDKMLVAPTTIYENVSQRFANRKSKLTEIVQLKSLNKGISNYILRKLEPTFPSTLQSSWHCNK